MGRKLSEEEEKEEVKESEESEEESVYDSGEEEYDSEASESDDNESDDDEEDDEFEEQGSSDEEDLLEEQAAVSDDDEDDSGDEVEILEAELTSVPRQWRTTSTKEEEVKEETKEEQAAKAAWMNTDDLSSDDEDFDGEQNRIGRVPLHWYEDQDHIGYNAHGKKVIKATSGDLLDAALQAESDKETKKFTVRDELNARDVTLTPRQIELIRRIQAGSFAHPEFDANPDMIDYYSSIKEVSGLNTNRYEPKARFQPSKYDKLLVRRLLHRLKCGSIDMDYLRNKQKKPHEQPDTKDPFLLWHGDEEDELHMRKGPQHIAPPKKPPPTHAESYNPSEEYLPTDEQLKEWEELETADRPHGLFVPTKFKNLRSVGSYQHSVREAFERCLDLYLCPRVMKRRLNIDPESLVPSLPKAADLRPFPTAMAVQFDTPAMTYSVKSAEEEGESKEVEETAMIRCLSVSPDGQYLVSGASDGFVRMWEVQTGRLLRSWNIAALVLADKKDKEEEKADENENETTTKEEDNEQDKNKPKPVVSIEWNPNSSHHCLIAAVENCAVIIATGTGGSDDAELTDALLSSAYNKRSAAGSTDGDNANINNSRAAKAVKWLPPPKTKRETPLSAYATFSGPITILRTNKEMAKVKWHKKGDYFLTVSPKANAASVLIHQLSKAISQQPFGKVKKGFGEIQCACFHPTKPFLFVASIQHVRVYHLIKQSMVKRLLSGCRWISSIDIHPSGDHVIIGSLDRRMCWFDLDLSNTPYKTLKYHERAIRSVGFHRRYPLMASSSDDGSIHVFHSMVYSDLMRNPLVVPVKVLRGGHSVVNKLGVLDFVFHPTQPWLFSAGADGKIILYQDI